MTAALLDRIFRSMGAARIAAEAEGWEAVPGNLRRMRRGADVIEIAEWMGDYAWSEVSDGR